MEDYYNKIKTDFLVVDDSLFRFESIDDGGYLLRPETVKNSNILFSSGISRPKCIELTLEGK